MARGHDFSFTVVTAAFSHRSHASKLRIRACAGVLSFSKCPVDRAMRSDLKMQKHQEHARPVWTPAWLEAIWQDAAYSVRHLRRQPGFTAVVLVTLTIGIGANTAIFSVVNAVLVRPLDAPDADRIVRLVGTSPAGTFPVASLPLAGVWLQQGGVLRDTDCGGGSSQLSRT
jgi:hypothetical protein